METNSTSNYIRIVTTKIINGKKERTFVLKPVTRKVKAEKLNKKVKKVIPWGNVNKQISKNICEINKTYWTKKAKDILEETRKVSKDIYDSTHEVFTLNNGFKATRYVKMTFRELPDMKIQSFEEKKDRLKKHREHQKALKLSKTMQKPSDIQRNTEFDYKRKQKEETVTIYKVTKKKNYEDFIIDKAIANHKSDLPVNYTPIGMVVPISKAEKTVKSIALHTNNKNIVHFFGIDSKNKIVTGHKVAA